ncbi:Uncharacterised protein [Mycobacteroides abscessus subsp. abscessus]|nr:Uncharacterised protein [Mycobacteroides abscessus subsp. abscessus]
MRTCGEIIPGIAIDARMAEASEPFCSHTDLPAIKSVATAVNGIGRSSIATSPSSSRTTSRIFSARKKPGLVQVGSNSLSTARWVKDVAHKANSSSAPAASRPPTNAPIDDPEIPEISKPRSCNSWITPMCA